MRAVVADGESTVIEEVRRLAERACDSLVLCVEIFNRPSDRGRTDSVLIMMDRSVELLLKAAIVHRGGGIWRKGDTETIDFNKAIRVALTNSDVKFLTESQARSLRHLHAQRNAAQHHLSEVPEGLLYPIVQTSLSVFRSVFEGVLDRRLADELPDRVSPLSISPPRDIQALFDSDIAEVRALLQPKRRQRANAEAKLAPWVVLEQVLSSGDPPLAVSRASLRTHADSIGAGETAGDLLPRVSAVTVENGQATVGIELKLTKDEGMAVRWVTGAEADGVPIAKKEVTELDRYPFGKKGAHKKLKEFFPDLTEPRAFAAIRLANVDDDLKYSKIIQIDKSAFRRYSSNVIEVVKKLIEERGIDEIWALEWARRKTESERKTAATARPSSLV